LAKLGRLTFEKPNFDNFPCLQIALDAMKDGGAAPIILNAANEVAVAKFLRGEIGFTQIAVEVEKALAKHSFSAPKSLDEVFAIDAEVRK
jgi:1-deoxy-D-xylulose-5-phosphate reductoisomerase